MAITASEARKNLFPLIEQVNDDAVEIEITSRKGNAVLVSASEWASIRETLYLTRSPVNADRLRRSIAEVRDGKFIQRDLIEPDPQ